MKKKKKQVVQEQEAVETTTVQAAIPVKEPQPRIVNCPKCGAALSLKEGGYAYMCPVCNSLLRLKTGARLVKDLKEGDKTLHVSITENAANYLLGKDCADTPANTSRTLESMLAKNIAEGYSNTDSIIVDVDENGLNIKKA